MKAAKFVLAIGVLLLTSCASNGNSIQSVLDHVSQESVHTPNNQKTYYAYYLPSGIGRMDATQTSNTFNVNGHTFVMNLDVASILHETNPQESHLFDRKKASDSFQGSYIDGNGKEIQYLLEIYPSGNQNIVYLKTDTLEFCSYTYAMDVAQIVEAMMRIARSTTVYRKQVIADFRLQNQITYETKKVELFENLVPENGTIDDLLIDPEEKNVSEDDEK